MVGITESAAAFGVLKSAYEFVRDLRKSNDPTVLRAGVEELTDRLLAAREDALKTSQEFDAMLNENKRLKAEIEKHNAWNEEVKRYVLREVLPRNYAYILRPEAQGQEPLHLVCPTCFAQGKKRIMQQCDLLRSICPECKTTIQDKPSPPIEAYSTSRYNPFDDI